MLLTFLTAILNTAVRAGGHLRRWYIINLVGIGPRNPGLMALGMGALMATNGQAPFHVLLIRATFYILKDHGLWPWNQG